ncbi:MAG: hypothetical protein B7Y39_11795 [Bdellovibrio sp. 28-41-41]|nr:MAG: hypothetical protein B7Y39_11795 [Bdellovibrio sp. 28-41-41]
MKSKQFLANLEKFCQQGNASLCPQPKNEERVPASTPVEVFKPIERPQLTKKYRSTRISVGVLPTAFLYKQSGVTTPAYDFAKSSQSSFILGLNYEIQDGIQEYRLPLNGLVRIFQYPDKIIRTFLFIKTILTCSFSFNPLVILR